MNVGEEPARVHTVAAARWQIDGRVQGVGYRPFVYRLAHRLGLAGWVRNHTGTVEIFAQGLPQALSAFEHGLTEGAPPLSAPRVLKSAAAEPRPLEGFSILPSLTGSPRRIHVPPDLCPCEDCLAELRDPGDRRHRYPFINCTQCGPRYSLIARMPYDRANTSMLTFDLCPACATEYRDPMDRRFHAQPVACPVCGPRLRFLPREGKPLKENEAALDACIDALRRGLTVAVKGVGGYHLMCDAHDRRAVARLRQLKHRPHKPLAVMFPADEGLSLVRTCVHLDPARERLLREPARPIVLAPVRPGQPLAPGIAPGLDEIGVFLAYSPLHHLLLEDYGAPLVATSANISGEPVLISEADVEKRLRHVADAFLHHDRAIQRPLDDPVYRCVAGAPRPLRLGRGNTPLELSLPFTLPVPLLAAGGHMKNTVALAWEDRIVVSSHIGDLEGPRARRAFRSTLEELQALYGVRAGAVVCDAHPGYASRRWAVESGLPVITVPHHRAHAAVLAGEHPDVQRWLVFTWDGTGYGEDGRLWGGEALLGRPGRWRRAASFRRFRIPGGERAATEPWRSALALCWARGRDWPECPVDATLPRQAWSRRINSPVTSAVGRLFDAAAALTGLGQESSFDGQAPMQLEAAAEPAAAGFALPLRTTAGGLCVADWGPLADLLTDASLGRAERAGMFHDALARTLVAQAAAVRARHGECIVGLCGGVFQNRRLTEQAVTLLHRAGFDVRLPRRVPVNDGGLSFGQVIEAGSEMISGKSNAEG